MPYNRSKNKPSLLPIEDAIVEYSSYNEELDPFECYIHMPMGILKLDITKHGFDIMMATGNYIFDKEKKILHYQEKED